MRLVISPFVCCQASLSSFLTASAWTHPSLLPAATTAPHTSSGSAKAEAPTRAFIPRTAKFKASAPHQPFDQHLLENIFASLSKLEQKLGYIEHKLNNLIDSVEKSDEDLAQDHFELNENINTCHHKLLTLTQVVEQQETNTANPIVQRSTAISTPTRFPTTEELFGTDSESDTPPWIKQESD